VSRAATFLQKSVFGTDGSHYDALIVRNSGTRRESDRESSTPFLQMDGRVLYEYMRQVIPRVVLECLTKNRLQLSDIDYFIFHPGSGHLLEGIRRDLQIPKEKMFCNFRHVGNTVSSTVPLALEQVMAAESMEGKCVLLCGFGVGLSWGVAVLSFD